MHDTVPHRGVLERAHDGRADRDDPSAARSRARDRASGRRRNVVRLVERQPRVELDIAGRGDAGGVRDRREADAARAQRREHPPVEREARRRRLERDRRAGDRRPHVPQRERLGARARTGSAGRGARCPPRSRRASRRSAARSAADARERPSPLPTADRARGDRRRASGGGSGRSSVRVWKSPAPKTTAEKSAHVVGDSERATGEPHFDRRAGSAVRAVQACRQRRGVVGDDEIAGPQNIDAAGARAMWRSALALVDDRAACAAAWPLPSQRRSCVATLADRDRVAMASSSSRAAASGRFSVEGSASGTASACSGVSMSPGSTDRKRTPCSASSASQMRRQVAKRGLARAIRAPRRIGVDGGVARHVQHDRAAAFARRRGERAEQRLRQPERPEHVRRERALQILAFGVAEQRQRRRPRSDALLTSTSRPPSSPRICSAIG